MNRVATVRLVNQALGASLAPHEVDALPADLIEAAIVMASPREDNDGTG